MEQIRRGKSYSTHQGEPVICCCYDRFWGGECIGGIALASFTWGRCYSPCNRACASSRSLCLRW